MFAYDFSNDTIIYEGSVIYKGQCIPTPPNYNDNCRNLTTINDKLYLNGWEWTGTKWKRTFKSLLHLFL